MSVIKPIRTEADYQAALARVGSLLGIAHDHPDADELEILVTLVEAYEARHYPIEEPETAEYISCKLAEQSALTDEVWVFHGAGGRFTSGVFVSKEQAEEFINQYRLTGTLTKYPLGLSAYDWAIRKQFFEPKKSEHYEAGFIQRFTTASQEHYHYEPDYLA